MNEFESWVYRGAIAILLGLVWYFIQAGFSGVRKDIQTLITEIKVLNSKSAGYDEKFSTMGNSVTSLTNRLDNNDNRIRCIEIVQASCRNRNTD